VQIDARIYKTVLDRINDGVFLVDPNRRIVFWNQGAYHLTGYKPEEVLEQSCPEGVLCRVDDAGHGLCADYCPLAASLSDGQTHEAEVFLRHKLGRRVPVYLRTDPIRADDGSIIGAMQVFTDDSARQDARRKAEDMERLAFLDDVTQLPNRRFLNLALQTALAEYRLHQEAFGVLLIDIDDFKTVNDRFGHSVGDRALREIAMTLVGALRPTDVVGRWGGDEFLAIVRHVNPEILRNLTDRCRMMVSKTSFPAGDGQAIFLSVSVGEALVRSSDTAESLFKTADTLMYQDKTDTGRAVYGTSG
jgi:diguanylate cyclase (GGDEF)-like protein/PAS domain S-box-containing protein